MTGVIKWGQKSKPQKVPRPKINLPKKTHGEVPSLNDIAHCASFGCSYLQNYDGHYQESSDCFEYAKKFLLKSSHPKNYLPNFPTQKNPRNENFKPRKILRSSPSLKIWSILPGVLPHLTVYQSRSPIFS